MTIVIFCRRNVGLYAVSYLGALGYDLKVISDDENVLWMAERLGQKIVTLETMGEYDYLFSVHWNKILDKKYLVEGRCVNFHPLLYKYKGQNPVKRFIKNEDTQGSVESHFMTAVPDEGEVIRQEFFKTPIIEQYSAFYDIAVPFYFKVIDRTLEILNNR